MTDKIVSLDAAVAAARAWYERFSGEVGTLDSLVAALRSLPAQEPVAPKNDVWCNVTTPHDRTPHRKGCSCEERRAEPVVNVEKGYAEKRRQFAEIERSGQVDADTLRFMNTCLDVRSILEAALVSPTTLQEAVAAERMVLRDIIAGACSLQLHGQPCAECQGAIDAIRERRKAR